MLIKKLLLTTIFSLIFALLFIYAFDRALESQDKMIEQSKIIINEGGVK